MSNFLGSGRLPAIISPEERQRRLVARDEKILAALCNPEILTDEEFQRGDSLLTEDAQEIWKSHSRNLVWCGFREIWIYSRHENYPV